MQTKLLTFTLFVNSFITGFTAPTSGVLTERESAIIKPIIEGLNITKPTDFQAMCIFQSLTRISIAFPEYPIDDLVARLPPKMFHPCVDSTSAPETKQCYQGLQ